jgi:hypothetical protein
MREQVRLTTNFFKNIVMKSEMVVSFYSELQFYDA